jgi:hypothetical protein
MQEATGYVGDIGFLVEYHRNTNRFSVTVQDIDDSGIKTGVSKHYFFSPEDVFSGFEEVLDDNFLEHKHGANFKYIVTMNYRCYDKLSEKADKIYDRVLSKNEASFPKHEVLPEALPEDILPKGRIEIVTPLKLL